MVRRLGRLFVNSTHHLRALTLPGRVLVSYRVLYSSFMGRKLMFSRTPIAALTTGIQGGGERSPHGR